MFSEYPQQLVFSGMEMPVAGELLNDTPYLRQLLAEIEQYKERQRMLKISSPKAKVESKPSKPFEGLLHRATQPRRSRNRLIPPGPLRWKC